VVNKYEDVGRFTAAQALRILRDKTPPDRVPVELPRNFSYLINLPVALQLGRYPPSSCSTWPRSSACSRRIADAHPGVHQA
jgi:ABC-type uncharacterized transport system substrate-binding protein